MMVNKNFTYIAGSIFLAFSAAIVSCYYIRSKQGLNAVHIYTSFLLMAGNIIMLRYLIPRNKFVGARLVSTHAQKENEMVISRVAKGGMIVFSLGAISYDTVGFLAEANCMDVFIAQDCKVQTSLTTAVYLLLKIFFMGLQIWFLFSEGYTISKLGYSDTNKHVFIFNSIINFTVIIYTTFHEGDNAAITPCEVPILHGNVTNRDEDKWDHLTQCLSHTTKLDTFGDKYEPYLYPFHSEYSILATTLNLILWKHFINSRKPKPRRRVFVGRTWVRSPEGSRRYVGGDGAPEAEDEREALIPIREEEEEEEAEIEMNTTLTNTVIQVADDLHGGDPDDDLSYLQGSNTYGAVETDAILEEPIHRKGLMAVLNECSRCSGCLNPRPSHIYGPDDGCGLFAFLGFALSIAYTVPSLLLDHKHIHRDTFKLVYGLTLVMSAATFVAALLLAIGTHRKLNLGPRFRKTLSVGSIVLILSAFVNFFFDFLFAIPAWHQAMYGVQNATDVEIKYHRSISAMPLIEQNIIDIINMVLNCLQVALQTDIVINNHWIMKRLCFDDIIYTSTMMQCMSFLMAANFCQWLVGSTIEAHQPQVNLGQIVFYGKDAWKFLVNLLYPFVIYYRFHCTMAFGEYMLWRRGLLDAGRVRAGSAGFVPSIGTLAY